MSQLELATRTDVSTRHLSFIETGRSRPTQAMLMRLSDQLDIPLRERNALLLAGGFAPVYAEHQLSDVPMAAISDAIDKVLTGHLPYPAVVVDRHWNLVDGNEAVVVLTSGCAPELLEPPANVLRLALHPEGMAPRIRNLGQTRAHLLGRLLHQAAATGDPDLAELHAELAQYPGGDDDGTPADPQTLVVPIQLRTTLPGRAEPADLRFFSTTTVFGTPLDITVAELAIEAFYPADSLTAAAFER